MTRHKRKTDRRHKKTRRVAAKQSSRRKQRGGRRVPIIRRYRGGMPEADDRPTIVYRPVDQDDPHGSSSATFSLDDAFDQSAHIDQYA